MKQYGFIFIALVLSLLLTACSKAKTETSSGSGLLSEEILNNYSEITDADDISSDVYDSDNKNEDETLNESSAGNGTQSKDKPSANVGTISKNENTSDDKDESNDASSATEASTEKTRYISAVEAKYYANEKNGYSIWSRSGMNGEYNFCVDSNGYITFKYSVNESSQTSVYNGVFITKEIVRENNVGNTMYRVRNASDGNVLYTAESKNGYSIIDFEYSSDSFFKDGYIMVLNKAESYNGVTYKVGILCSNGKWIVPMSEDNPIVKTIGSSATESAFRKMRYLGEDILHFETDNGNYFYNVKKNSVVKVSSELTESQTSSVLNCAGPFNNGVCVDAYGYGKGICKITSSGKITVLPTNFSDKLHETEGTMYYDVKNDRVIRMGYTYHVDGFSVFDSKGKIIKKISDVTLVEVNGFSAEGIAQIVIENKEGTKYYTLINTSGEFLFEPIKMETSYIIDISGNMISNGESNATKADAAIVDRNGRVLYRRKGSGDFGFKNGIVMDKGLDNEYVQIVK